MDGPDDNLNDKDCVEGCPAPPHFHRLHELGVHHEEPRSNMGRLNCLTNACGEHSEPMQGGDEEGGSEVSGDMTICVDGIKQCVCQICNGDYGDHLDDDEDDALPPSLGYSRRQMAGKLQLVWVLTCISGV